MQAPNKRWIYVNILVVVVMLAATILPYLYAAGQAGADYVFGGVLLNPVDGNTYLAKMYQGWRGDWRFSLPYTAEQGEGVYLFLFYLSLGHLSRVLHLPLALTFHGARLAAAVLMVLAIGRFFRKTLPGENQQVFAFLLAGFGSGMGWTALLFGGFTSDFWVAEAYPFLSAFVNPHFPFGTALLVWIFGSALDFRAAGWRSVLAGYLLPASILSLIAPFGVVVALVVLTGMLVWTAAVPAVGAGSGAAANPAGRWWRKLFPQAIPLGATALAGAPGMLYAAWVAQHDPLLAGWNAQNLTPSPPPGDLILSLSPALILALPGLWAAWKQRTPGLRLLALWLFLGILLLYLPWSLQRRFMMALYIPTAGLAAVGIGGLAAAVRRRARASVAALFLLSLPTNLFVFVALLQGVQTHDPLLYLTRSEAQAFAWLAENTPGDALVLASPESGLFIPAATGRRVIYGHPFETVNAEAEKAQVVQFFQEAPSWDGDGWVKERGVEYILWGPREQALGGAGAPPAGAESVYAADGVTIYAVR